MLLVLVGFIVLSIGDCFGLIVGFVVGVLVNIGGVGFLGVLIGGFLVGYVIVFLCKLFKNLLKLLDGIKMIFFYLVFGLLIIGFLMLLVNVFMKVINDVLNGFLISMSGLNVVLFGVLLVGMMVVDLGGLINKVVYVFGIVILVMIVVIGGSVVMVFVMVGGMVFLLVIFVVICLFKNKFSKID